MLSIVRDSVGELPTINVGLGTSFVFNAIDENGAPYDLTDALEMYFAIGEYAGASSRDLTLSLVRGISHTGVDGVITITLSANDTGRLTASTRWFDLWYKDSNGNSRNICSGPIIVKENLVITVDPDAPEIINEIDVINEFLSVAHNPDGTLRTISADIILLDNIALRDIIDAKASLFSPAFSGEPTAPTPNSGDVSNQIVTTAFVDNEIATLISSLASGGTAVDAAGVVVANEHIAASNVNTAFTEIIGRIDNVEAGQASGAIGYATKTALDADLLHDAGAIAYVTNDPATNNNGMYRKSGASGTGSWIAASTDRITTLLPSAGFYTLPPESGYVAAWVDPITGRSVMRITVNGAVEIDTITLGSNVVTLSNLSTELQGFIPTTLAIESGYVWALVDPVTKRAPVRLTVAGAFEIDGFTLPNESVTESNLSPALFTLLPATLPIETGYAWALIDPVTNRAPVRVRLDGTFEADSFATGSSTVGMAALASDALRQLAPNVHDVVPVRPDVWRGKRGEVAVLTEADGSMWAEIGSLRTRWIGGTNLSGTTLELRRTAGVPITGRRYGGSSFDAGAHPSINYKGSITSTTPSAPSGSFVTGDYYIYANGLGDAGVYNSVTLNVGDLLVYNGSIWVVSAAPGTYGSRTRGQWWDVNIAGWWDGAQYNVGDRIVYVGKQSGSSITIFERWAKYASRQGGFFYRGEFAPSSGLPVTYIDDDIFQASASGSAGGFTFAIGDYLIRDNGIWGQIATSAIISVASNAYFSGACVLDANEWEVRRQDKGTTVTGVRFGALAQSIMRRNADTLTLISDSMFGVASTGNVIITAAQRSGSVRTYGGGTSLDVLSMFEWWITQEDPYAGQVLLAWHGQNNQPSSEMNAAQIRWVSLRMAELAGARDARMLFLSVLGQRNHTWTGSRITVSQHENQFANTGYLYDLNVWYERTFPGRWISPWSVLLSAATDAPDPTFPGMTEKQVAATYGIVPWSFYGSPGGSWITAQLLYQGNWSDVVLPTGGVNLDYYLRIGGGTVGNLLVNEAGTWVERSIDTTHLSAAGAIALASGGPGQSNIASSTGVAGFLIDNLL